MKELEGSVTVTKEGKRHGQTGVIVSNSRTRAEYVVQFADGGIETFGTYDLEPAKTD